MERRRVFQRWMLFIILILNAISVLGQPCLVGMIKDTTSDKPVEGAVVRLSQTLAAITDHNGLFRICQVPQGQNEMEVSCLGYETRHLTLDAAAFSGAVITYSLSPSMIRMNEVVVTATRTENSLGHIPVRVNLLTSQVIQDQPAGSIDEILRTVPGIQVDRPFGIFSSKSTVSMRGLSGKEQARFLVLLDGIPLNKSDGGTVDWNMIDPGNVSRIEIMKGAGSALYGGNAMGGIINILSAVPEKKLEGKASVDYGTYNTLGGRLSLGGKKQLNEESRLFYWSTGVLFRKSDGYITQPESEIKANPYIVKSNIQEVSTYLKSGFSFNKNNSIDLRFSLYDDKRGTGEKVFQLDGNITEHDSYGGTLHYKGNFHGLVLNSSLFLQQENYKKVNEYLKDDYTWYEVLSVRRDLGWINSLSGKFRNNHMFTGGIEFKLGSVDAQDKYFTSTDIVNNEGKMATYSAYIQDEMKVMNDRLRLIAGLRYDLSRYFEGSFRIEAPTRETSFMNSYQVPAMPVENWMALSPRLSLQYRLHGQDRVYLSFSRGFRPSNLDDLCRSGRIKGGFKIANPALEPEYLNNIETGLDLELLKGMNATVSVYYSIGNDFQYYVSNGQTIDMGFGDRPIFIRSNITQVKIFGSELEVTYRLNDHFTSFVNGGYNHSVIGDYQRISGSDTLDLSGKFLTDVPKVVVSAGATFTSNVINTMLFFRYMDKMFVNDQNSFDEILISEYYAAYTVLDLKIWKEFRKRYKIGIDVQNLFDQKYYDSKESVCPGRFFTAELSIKF